jgi:hypothetical protein
MATRGSKRSSNATAKIIELIFLDHAERTP